MKNVLLEVSLIIPSESSLKPLAIIQSNLHSNTSSILILDARLSASISMPENNSGELQTNLSLKAGFTLNFDWVSWGFILQGLENLQGHPTGTFQGQVSTSPFQIFPAVCHPPTLNHSEKTELHLLNDLPVGTGGCCYALPKPPLNGSTMNNSGSPRFSSRGKFSRLVVSVVSPPGY